MAKFEVDPYDKNAYDQTLSDSIEKRRLHGYQLFVDLTKDGCTWQGDVNSMKWAECLFFTPENKQAVMRTLSMYWEGVDYRLEGDAVEAYAVWIA